MTAQIKISRAKDGRAVVTVAIGEDTYRAYITEAELQGYKTLLNSWETDSGPHSVSSPVLEIEIDPTEK